MDAGERVDLENVRHPARVAAEVDPRPVAAAQDAIGGERRTLDLESEGAVDLGGTAEDVEGRLRLVPDPLRLVRVDGQRILGQGVEVDLDEGEDARLFPVAQDPARELPAPQVALHDGGLAVALDEIRDLSPRLVRRRAERRARDPHARSFVHGFHHGRPGREAVQLLHPSHHREGRGGDPVMSQDFLGASLVQAQRHGHGIAARVRSGPELADRGHVRLAVGAADAFRDVEHHVGAQVVEPQGKVVIRFHADHGAGP